MKEESETVGLKLNIQKTKIMASGPITSWEIDGKTVEAVSDFTFCLFGKAFILPSILNDNFARYSTLGWNIFSSNT